MDVGGKLDFSNEENKSKGTSYAKYGMLPFLKSLGVNHIERVFITHGHQDHYGDLVEIALSIPMREVIFPKGTRSDKGFDRAVKALDELGVLSKEVLSNALWKSNSFIFRSVYPDKMGDGGNDDSLVLHGKIKNKTFLLMGDLEKEGEGKLLSKGLNLKSDILSTDQQGMIYYQWNAFSNELSEVKYLLYED